MTQPRCGDRPLFHQRPAYGPPNHLVYRARPILHEIGPIAKPKRILIVPELPKTRSGKIMRRLLRDIDYQGYITVEQERDPRNASGSLEDVRGSLDYLKSVGF